MKRGKFLALLGGIAITPVITNDLFKAEKPNPKEVKSYIDGGMVTFRDTPIQSLDSWCNDDFTENYKTLYNEMTLKLLTK